MKSTKSLPSRALIRAFFALALCPGEAVLSAPTVEWQLNVAYANVAGRCLFQGNWIPTKSDYLYWELIRIDDPSRYTGKFGEPWQFVRAHKYSFLIPKEYNSAATETEEKFFFNLEIINEGEVKFKRELSEKLNWHPNDLAYVDKLRSNLKIPGLLPATAIRYVKESDLYELNRLNSFNPFERNIDGREVVVPIGKTVCDLNFDYVMKGSKARYTQNLLGTKTLISNETVPIKSGEKSFAEEWLNHN